MSLESKSVNQLAKYNDVANTMMTPAIKSALRTYGIAGAFMWVLPFHGAETFGYALVLWSMYIKIAKLSNRKFGFSAVMGGFFINIMICLVLNLFGDFLNYIGIGFILAAILGYVLTYQSGKSYLGYLAKLKEKVSK